jgi:hypothetical protein
MTIFKRDRLARLDRPGIGNIARAIIFIQKEAELLLIYEN